MDNLSKIDNVEVNYEDVKKAEEYKKRRKKDIFSGQRIRISTLSLFHCYNNKQ